jgi:hypothetical protein
MLFLRILNISVRVAALSQTAVQLEQSVQFETSYFEPSD